MSAPVQENGAGPAASARYTDVLPALQRLVLASLTGALVMGLAALSAQALRFLHADPTGAEYLAHAKQGATLVPAGELRIDGQSYACGHVPTVLSTRIDDFGAAYFGLILLHPERFKTMSPVLRRYAFAHECGHQFIGRDEFAADCYAVRAGLDEGWLDAGAMDEICDFITPTTGSERHPPGPARCAHMRQCFAMTTAAALRH